MISTYWMYLAWVLVNFCLALVFGSLGAKLRNPWAYTVFGSCALLSLISFSTCFYYMGTEYDLIPLSLSDGLENLVTSKLRYHLQALAMVGFAVGYLLFAFSLKNLRHSDSTANV